MDDAPDAALGLVLLKDVLNVALDRDVALVDGNLERLLVLLGRSGRKGILRELSDTLEGGGERVVVAGGDECTFGVGRQAKKREARREGQERKEGGARSVPPGRSPGAPGDRGTHLSIVTTLYWPESKQDSAMCEPAARDRDARLARTESREDGVAGDAHRCSPLHR